MADAKEAAESWQKVGAVAALRAAADDLELEARATPAFDNPDERPGYDYARQMLNDARWLRERAVRLGSAGS